MTPIDPVHRKLGFIGIGSMGRPIARRLLESGYKVMVYNRDRSKAEALVDYAPRSQKSLASLRSMPTLFCHALRMMTRCEAFIWELKAYSRTRVPGR